MESRRVRLDPSMVILWEDFFSGDDRTKEISNLAMREIEEKNTARELPW